jgi:hypothetical protein
MAKTKTIDRVLYLAEIGGLLPPDALREGNGRKLRSTPIPWLKFRTAADTTAAGQRYAMRRRAVKADDRGMAILGIYDELLLTYGGDRIAPLRGYLVNHHMRAATTAEIAMEIGWHDRDLVDHAIQVLLQVGLLVWRTRPDFQEAIRVDRTLAPSYDPPDDPDDSLANDVPAGIEATADDVPSGPRRRQRVRAQIKKAAKPRAKSRPASCPQPAGEPPTDIILDTGDGRRVTGDPKLDTPAAESATPPPLSADGNGETEEERQPASAAPSPADVQTGGEEQEASGDTQPQADVQHEPEHHDGSHAIPGGTEPTAEPLEPTEADPGQGGTASNIPGRKGPDMAWHAESFAQQVMATLYPAHEDYILQGRLVHTGPQGPDEFQAREGGCILRAFEHALMGMDQVTALRLLTHSLKQAQETHRKKCRDTRGRLWRHLFGEYVATIRRGRAPASGPPPGGG